MNASPWQPVSGIEGPCAEIGLALSRHDRLVVTMHFSLVRGLPDRDLRLFFEGALALHWENECPGFYPLPKNISKCSDPKWERYVFPLQTVEGSELLEQFREVYQVGDRPTLAHFLLISMDDLLHIIAPSGATAMWVEGLGESTYEA